MVIGDVIEGWKDIVRDVRDPAGAEERRREEQLGRFLGTGTEEYAKAVYGREWATHYTTGWQPGGRLWLQREAEAEKEREAKRRAAISDYLDQQAKKAKERAAAEARQEAEARATESRAAALKPLPPERAETWLEATTPSQIRAAEIQEPSGFSITQKYFEFMGTGFDPKTGKVYRKTKFYKPGERERLIEEKAEELKPTYEERYQKEFEKKYGKKIAAGEISFYQASKEFDRSKEAEKISVTYEIEAVSAAPTSKVGNLVIGLTDFLFKSQFFSPFMSTAQASKSKKAKSEQEVVYVRDFKSLNKPDYNTLLNQIRSRYSTQQLREMYAIALRTGESKKIKLMEKIIKDLYAPTKIGKKAASTFLKDVKVQEGMIKIKGKTIYPSGIEPVGMPKTLEFVPEVITGVKAVTIQKEQAKQQAKQTQRLNQALSAFTGFKTKQEQKARQKLKLGISLAQPQLQAPKFAQPQPQKIANILGFGGAPAQPKAKIPKPLIFIPGLVLPPYAKKETQAEKKRRKIEDAKIRKQQRAYQASVGAVVLGLRYKRIPKRRKFTGLGLRYMFPKQKRSISKQKRNSRKPTRKRTTSNYLKRIQNIFK